MAICRCYVSLSDGNPSTNFPKMQSDCSHAGVLSRVRIEWDEDTANEIERASRAFTGPKGFKGMLLDCI